MSNNTTTSQQDTPKKSFSLNSLFIGLSLIFIVVLSYIYFSPVLQHKQILQHDITQFKGANEEVKQFKEQTGENTYWVNSMFSGMPNYQSGAEYPYDFLRWIDGHIIRALPSPIDYIVLLFAGFFFLAIVWLKDWKYALLGSIMFSFSTYFFIIIEAGHNAKVHTLGYFAPFVAGVYLLYHKKYIWGFICTALFLGLQLSANHPQMTYYLFLAMVSYGVVELVKTIQKKEYKSFGIATGLLVLAVGLAVGMNAPRYMATYEYTKESTRGKSEITIGKTENKEKTSGLDRSYITQWSYGISETFNLLIPHFMGGGSHEKIDKTNTEKMLLQMGYDPAQSNQVSSYWGEQPITSGPAYQGVVAIVLGILALFFYRKKYKWWFVSSTILAILLAWGKNFGFLTDFFIDYFPFYNKFRAVSSILVIAEFLVPLLGIIGLYSFFKDEKLSFDYKKKTILYTGIGFVLLLLFFYLLGGTLLDFRTQQEGDYLPAEILNALKKDRIELFKSDILRTLFFIFVIFGLLLAALYNKLKSTVVVILLTLIALVDLWSINKKYLNNDKFVDNKYVENPFRTTPIAQTDGNAVLESLSAQAPINKFLDSLKKKDKSNYRVLNTLLGYDENTTTYFHQNIGGYHAVKLRRYQDLIDVHMDFKKGPTMEVLNMLNTKYIIVADSTKGITIEPNIYANGNAWFVKNIKYTSNPNNEIQALSKIKTIETAIVDEKDKNYITNAKIAVDSTAYILLEHAQPNQLTYKAKTDTNQFAVFSEIYYPYGWNAYIDGKKADYIRTDYTLRGLVIPKGNHTIEFKFKPEVIQSSSKISLFSFFAFIVLAIVGLVLQHRNKKIKS